jgi:CubicO group peptidase (beta-lactamase class C family)
VNEPDCNRFKVFAALLEDLREELKIPGMAAGIVMNQELIWAQGFGYADLEKKIKTTPDTPFDIASVGKTFTAALAMQLVWEGKLNLDDPLTKFGISYGKDRGVKVKHILSHTSQFTPGKNFRYSGRLWEYLARVIVSAGGQSFKTLMVKKILIPLQLTNTFPNKESANEPYPYESLYGTVATPYFLDEKFKIKKSKYRFGFYAAGGLLSSITDMAKFDIALDNDKLIPANLKKLMFTPFISTDGKKLPHGLGWFVQFYNNLRLVWHYGWDPGCASALMVKVPEKKLTFILMANTDKLSQPFGLRHGNLLNSPAAILFLKTFVFSETDSAQFLEQETAAKEIIQYSTGRKPIPSPIPNFLLNVCFLIFLSPLLVCLVKLILRLPFVRGKKPVNPVISKNKMGTIGFLYFLLFGLLGIMFMGALLQAPFLIYWQDFPGWIDGIPLYQNLFLILPTVLGVLFVGLILFTVLMWIKKWSTLLFRCYYTVGFLFAALYIFFLGKWNLIHFTYYLKFL